MACTNRKGIPFIIHALHLDGNRYLSLLGFFRSGAYEIQEIRNVWAQIVSPCGFVYHLNGKVLLIGDGTKIPKEGKRKFLRNVRDPGCGSCGVTSCRVPERILKGDGQNSRRFRKETSGGLSGSQVSMPGRSDRTDRKGWLTEKLGCDTIENKENSF